MANIVAGLRRQTQGMAGGTRTWARTVLLALALAVTATGSAQGAELTNPGDGARVSPTPTLEWRLGSGDETWAVDISKDPGTFSDTNLVRPGDAQSFTVKTELGSGTHYWRLRYWDSAGELRTTPPRSFVVSAPPLDKLWVVAGRTWTDPDEDSEDEELDYLDNSTAFVVGATPYAAVDLAITYGNKRVYTSTLREAGVAPDPYAATDYLGDTYAWSCGRQGKHTWTVTAFDEYGGTRVSTGTFTPGRCGERPAQLRRTDLIRWIEGDDFKPDDFVNYIKCQPASKLTSKGAHAWRCVVRWNNLRRECGARFLFRYYERLRFNEVVTNPIRLRRETKLACRQLFG